MPQIRPHACFGLTRAQLETIHRSAAALAVRTGFLVRNGALLERLHGRQGFTVTEERIFPSEERIEAFLASLRARHPQDLPPNPDDPPILYTSDRPFHTVAEDGISLRKLTRQDVIDGAKLIYMLYDRGVRGGAPGVPSDVDPLLAPFEQMLIGMRYGRGGTYSSHAVTGWHARWMERIARALGESYGLSVWMPSPFRLEGNELDIVLEMEGKFDALGVGSMPLMGFTAPMSELQTWVQALAETIGAAAILQEAFPGIPIEIYPHPKPADIRTGEYGIGLPEMHVLDALKSEILPFYGLQPPWGKSAATAAIIPGPQSQTEHTASYLIGYLHGYRAFDMAGTLAGGEVFSPLQLLFDVETVTWAERYARGFTWEDNIDLDRWTEQAQSDALFAEDPDEVARMRALYRPTGLFRCNTVGRYQAACPDLVAEANAEIRRLLGGYAYEPDIERLAIAERIVAEARENPPPGA